MRGATVALLFLVFTGTGVGVVGCGFSSPTTPVNSRDGVYDFSFVYNNNGTPETVVLPQYFIVTNDVLSSNPQELSGFVLDDFGNVRFSGPCPVNNGGAVFTGTLNLLNPMGGRGDWKCDIGGVSNTWRAYNGHPQ